MLVTCDRYVRALGALYMRMVGKALDVYQVKKGGGGL